MIYLRNNQIKLTKYKESNMKKAKYLILLMFVVLFISCTKYPKEYPKLKVIVNNNEYSTEENAGIWMDKDKVGNGIPEERNIILAERAEAIEVKSDSELDLQLTYRKGIKYFKCWTINEDESGKELLEEVEVNNYILEVPNDEEEASYVVEAHWDETHYMHYVFKVKVLK